MTPTNALVAKLVLATGLAPATITAVLKGRGTPRGKGHRAATVTLIERALADIEREKTTGG